MIGSSEQATIIASEPGREFVPERRIGVETLPRLLTSFVGREATAAALLEELRNPGQRLLTVTGPGGIGKTRLVIAVGEAAAAEFPDGVWYVALANITDYRQVPTTILRTLGIRQTGTRSIEEDILSFLIDRRSMIILDNFEQLLEAGPFLSRIVNSCPQVTLVVTSQAVLRLRSEKNFPVPALSTSKMPGSATGELSEAVRLFVERALLVKTDFELTPENEQIVQEICRELDGLPLSIELAAARIRFLTPAALLERLRAEEGDSLRLLTGGPRDALQRHRSLQETIAWSYDLLEPRDRSLFRRLSVFPGGFDVDSAASVWINDLDNDASLDVFEGIASLLDKSLLIQRQLPDGDTRFHMLAIVRDFAREELARSGEENEIRDAFADCYLELAENAEAQLRGPAQNLARIRLTTEHANLIAALSWFESRRLSEKGHRLAWSLFFYWWSRGLGTESRDWYERMLDMDGEEAGPLRPWVEYAATVGAVVQGDYDRAGELVGIAMQTCRRYGDLVAEALIHALDAYVRLVREDSEGAIAAGELAVEMLREHANGFWLATGLAEAGLFISAAGKPEVGVPLVERALELDLLRGDALLAGVRLSDLGVMAHDRGDVEHAVARYRDSIASLRQAGGEWYLASPISGIAAVLATVDAHTAAQLLGAAKQLRERGGTVGWATEIARDARATVDATDQIGADVFAKAFIEGRRLSVDAIVAMADQAAGRMIGDSAKLSAGVNDLTERELEVLKLIVTGMSDREIGDVLFISPRTASKHVGNILNKLGLESRSEAAAYAVRHGVG